MKTFADGVLWAAEGFALLAMGRVLLDWIVALRAEARKRRENLMRAARKPLGGHGPDESTREGERPACGDTLIPELSGPGGELLKFPGGKMHTGGEGGLVTRRPDASGVQSPGQDLSDGKASDGFEISSGSGVAVDGPAAVGGAPVDCGTMVGDVGSVMGMVDAAGPRGSVARRGQDGKVSSVLPALADQRAEDAGHGRDARATLVRRFSDGFWGGQRREL